jgi:hypothetical protein
MLAPKYDTIIMPQFDAPNMAKHNYSPRKGMLSTELFC